MTSKSNAKSTTPMTPQAAQRIQSATEDAGSDQVETNSTYIKELA